MLKRGYVYLLLALLSLVTSCASTVPSRKIAGGFAGGDGPQLQPNASKNGLLTLTRLMSSGNRLILVGVKSDLEVGLNQFDPSQIGFDSDGQDVTKLNPKFIFEVTGQQAGAGSLKRVYAFDLGVDANGMPKILFDYDKVLTVHHIAQAMKAGIGASVIGLEPLTASVGYPIANLITHRDLKSDTAFYLEYLVDKTLPFSSLLEIPELVTPAYFSSLRGAVGDAALTQIGSAVYLKYADLGPVISIFANQIDLEHSYSALRASRRDSSVQQSGSLSAKANRNDGLHVYTTGDFQITTLDCDQSLVTAQKEHRFFSYKLDIKTKDAEKLRLDILNLCEAGGEIPLGLYSDSNGGDFYQISDYSSPNKLRNQAFDIAVMNISTEVAAATVSVSKYPIKLGKILVSHFIKRTGSKVFSSPRGMIYPQYRAAVDSGLLDESFLPDHLTDDDTFKAVLLKILDASEGATAQSKAVIAAQLSSKDSSEVQQGFLKISKLSSQNQRGTRFFSGRNQSARESKKAIAARAGMAQFFNDKEKVARLDRDLALRVTLQNSKAPKQAAVANTSAKLSAVPNTKTEFSQAGLAPGVNRQMCFGNEPSLILFKVDGLMVERLEAAALRGFTPTIKARFLDNGVQLKNVFTRNSISTASWIEAETGFRSSDTGVIGSASTTRDPRQKIDNYLNPIHEFGGKTAGLLGDSKGTRTYQILQRSGIKLIDDRLEPRSYDAWNVLVHNGKNAPIFGMQSQLVKSGLGLFFTNLLAAKNVDLSSIFDRGAGQEVADEIKNNPCQYRVVQIWLGGADHAGHSNPNSSQEAFRSIDKAVDLVLTQAAKDPVLKNAKIMIVSDHGLDGGIIRAQGDYDFVGMDTAYHLNNTEFNVHKYLSGQASATANKYFETVISHNGRPEAQSGEAIVKFLENPARIFGGLGAILSANPSSIEKGFRGRSGIKLTEGKDYHRNATLAVESYGDAQVEIFVLNHPEQPDRRSRYFELSNFQPSPIYSRPVNIINDLLTAAVTNLDPSEQGPVMDELVHKRVREITGARPVGSVAMALPPGPNRDAFIAAVMSQAGLKGTISRDPILIKKLDVTTNRPKTALLLIHDNANPDGSDYTVPQLAYVVVKDFDEASSGIYSGAVVPSGDTETDPLNYQSLKSARGEFLDEDSLLKLTLASKGNEVTLPFLVGLLAPSPKLMKTSFGKNAAAGVPDLILWANPGFNFNTSQNHDGDHGSPLSSRISWLIGDCKHGPSENNLVETPSYSTALTPTILEYLGQPIPTGLASKSLRSEIESRCN